MEMTSRVVSIKNENDSSESRLAIQTLNVQKYVADTLDSKAKGLFMNYNRMISELEFSLTQKPEDLIVWFRSLSQNASRISEKHHEQLISTLTMKFDWSRANNEVTGAYIDFLLNLLSANGCFTSFCCKSIVKSLYPIPSSDQFKDSQKTPVKYDQDLTNKVHGHVHQALQSVLSIVPSASSSLIGVIQQHFPHHRRHDVETHQVYLSNILKIVQYFPSLRDRILELCVDKIIQLDVAIKLDDVPDEDDEDLVFEVEMEVPEMAEKLDEMMDLLLQFIDDCIERGIANDLWTILVKLFDSKVLTTHKSKYTQFLVFYLSRANEVYPKHFLDFLQGRLFDSKNHTLTRQTCSAYVGSFISRAKFISIHSIRSTLTDMMKWAHVYVKNAQKPTPDADLHGLFYSVCQSIFYIICFHHEQLFSEHDGREYFHKLQLERITSSPLNPLKFAIPAVVNEFGRICGMLGLLACCETIEQNKGLVIPTRGLLGGNNQLDSFFPFDPYLLRKSSKRIKPIYNEWQASEPEQSVSQEIAEYEELEESDDESPSSSLGSDLKSMSLTPVVSTLDHMFHFRNRSGSITTSPKL